MLESHRNGPNAPTMLMLSSVLPDEHGPEDARRVWNVLRLVGLTHRVTLMACVPGPVHLHHWRQVAAMVDRVELVPPTRSWGRLGRRMADWLAGRARAAAELAFAFTDSDCLRKPFDAVLCCSPYLWSVVAQLHVGVRLCDVRSLDHAAAVAMTEQADVILASCSQAAALPNQRARVVTILSPTHEAAQEIQSRRLEIRMTDLLPTSSSPTTTAAQEQADATFRVIWRGKPADVMRAAA